jgi:hypothetical protein
MPFTAQCDADAFANGLLILHDGYLPKTDTHRHKCNAAAGAGWLEMAAFVSTQFALTSAVRRHRAIPSLWSNPTKQGPEDRCGIQQSHGSSSWAAWLSRSSYL